MIMELHQLEYFAAVADEGNFTRAAARLHVAQPGVSAQIRRLERELGEELLDRSGRVVRLTEAGAAVLPYARAALEAVAGVRLAVDELTGLLRGHVTVGMVASLSVLDVPGLLAAFHDDHPAVEITLSEATTASLAGALTEGRIDMALIGLGAGAPPGVATQVVIDQQLVAVVGRGDPLAGQATVTLKALQERALISLPHGTGLRSVIDEAFAAAGLSPRIAFEASEPPVLVQLAARGLGVAIVPASAASTPTANVHAIEITHPQVRGRIALAWRAEGPVSPPARALIAHARKSLTPSPDPPSPDPS
jgi:DNA-binding transcriptional LysR family regulator